MTDAWVTTLQRPIRLKQLTDIGLAHISRADSVESLNLDGTYTDNGFVGLSSLKRLRALDVTSPNVSTSLSSLQDCTRLNTLTIRYVSDVSLLHIARAVSISDLDVRGDFTDAGLAHLTQLPQLEVLWLSSPLITDEGLKCLGHCTRLESVRIVGNAPTPLGVARLRRALPKCRIEWFSEDGNRRL